MKNIVLYDFSLESDHALKYAIAFTKQLKGSLDIVYVSQKEDYLKNFRKLEKLQIKHASPDISIEIYEKMGYLEEELNNYVKKNKVGLVFSGTHDMKSLEKIFSSRILKLMNNINANFIFIPPTLDEFRPLKKVLVPIFSDHHTLQKLEVLRFLNLIFNFEFILCSYKDKNHETDSSIMIASKILKEAGIKFDFAFIGTSEKEFERQLLDCAYKHNVDMISIVNLTERNMINHNAKVLVDGLIRNDYSIPVLVVQNQNIDSLM